MRGFRYTLLLLLLFLGISVPLAKQLWKNNSASIDGFVTDETGAPVSRAAVHAYTKLRGDSGHTMTENNGFYRISGLNGGQYSLYAQAQGYSLGWVPTVNVDDGQATHQNVQVRRENPRNPTRNAFP